MNLTEDQWKAKLEEIAAAGRMRNGYSIPWDFKASGSVWFEGGDFGLSALNREALARSMDNLLNLKAPYKDAYCTLTLHITGAVSRDSKTREIVKSRVESVRLWFIERGYDPTLIRAGAWYGSEPKEVQWELEGGLWSSRHCNLERSKQRGYLAKELGGWHLN
ncbi:MAG: hypothetical protein FD135_4922 [Comamonadaceae bacterium]|nr:MAG: hypothetical protein FD135_4922 [Comamonadaceae bacterium]